MTTLDAIQKQIAEKFDLQASELEAGLPLDTLGIDSLAVTEFMFDLEDEFKIRIPYAPLEIKTLQDIAATYIPHIADAIRREFPRSYGSRLVALPGHAEQIEHLALQRGEFGMEDLDGVFATPQRMALGVAE